MPPKVEITIPIWEREKLVATPTRGCDINKNIFPAAQIKPGIILRMAYLLNGRCLNVSRIPPNTMPIACGNNADHPSILNNRITTT